MKNKRRPSKRDDEMTMRYNGDEVTRDTHNFRSGHWEAQTSVASSQHSSYNRSNELEEGVCFHEYIVQTCGADAPQNFSD